MLLYLYCNWHQDKLINSYVNWSKPKIWVVNTNDFNLNLYHFVLFCHNQWKINVFHPQVMHVFERKCSSIRNHQISCMTLETIRNHQISCMTLMCFSILVLKRTYEIEWDILMVQNVCNKETICIAWSITPTNDLGLMQSYLVNIGYMLTNVAYINCLRYSIDVFVLVPFWSSIAVWWIGFQREPLICFDCPFTLV